jgi:hypothetical protein
MMHPMDSTAHGAMMPMRVASGANHRMGAMSGTMGTGTTPQTMGGMAVHMTRMLAVMQKRLVRIQVLMKDSAVAHNPQAMHDLRLTQRHMASMMGEIGPMIARMEQMHRPDTTRTKNP